jgi:hypothetical protein
MTRNIGTFVRTYPSGTKEYEKKATMTDKEAEDYYVMMESTIKNSAVESLGGEGGSIDYDTETGLVTKWVTPSAENGWAQKEFYQAKISGIKVTDVRSNGTERSYYKDIEVGFEFRGTKQ